MSEDLIRLSKLMSERGLCSRREADDLIAKGLVKVDGQVVNQLGTKVSPLATVEVVGRGQKVKYEDDFQHWHTDKSETHTYPPQPERFDSPLNTSEDAA